ncbi:unnamed protein product [Hymenolepis diminuta]|uniref:Uncharacterized protein n=1 Tax=Hymenolepis diminuta TaxID=6216 RepID=A0A0R3SK07_HYMDI|nr:unnamed protein product [Hymenolepis diminuta]
MPVLERKPKYFILDRSGTKDSVSIDTLKPAYVELSDVNPTSALPIPSPVVPPDNVHPPNTRAQYPSKDTIQPSASPVQSSSQDTVKSTTPPSCASRHKHSRTCCGRRVTLPSRRVDYTQ